MGGLSHHEIVQIDLLQKEMPAQIIPGSNQIISCNDFIEQLESLHKKESQEYFRDRIAKSVAQIDVPGVKADMDSTADFDFSINWEIARFPIKSKLASDQFKVKHLVLTLY